MPSVRVRHSAVLLQLLISTLFFPTTTIAQSTTIKQSTIKLTTVGPIPSGFTVPARCFAPVVNLDPETIFNIGCGISSRTTCCPPSFGANVIYSPQTRTSARCPDGYISSPVYGGTTNTLKTAGTVICCPSAVPLWSLFNAGLLCYTQRELTTSSTSTWWSTYARAFVIAETVQATSTSTSSSTTKTVSSIKTTGPTQTAGRTETAVDNSGSQTVSGSQPAATDTEAASGGKGGLSIGAIAGIVVAILIPILGVVGFLIYRLRNKKTTTAEDDMPIPPPPERDNSLDEYANVPNLPPADAFPLTPLGKHGDYIYPPKFEISDGRTGSASSGNEAMVYTGNPAFENVEKSPAVDDPMTGGHFS